MDIRAEKKALRRECLLRVKELSEAEIQSKSRRILDKILYLPVLTKVRVIGTYYSIGNEVNTTELLELLLDRGYKLALPVIPPLPEPALRTMYFRTVRSLQNLPPGRLGIPEPRDGRPVAPEEIDLLIVPGVAFDRRGRRLGRGAGYYDRFLPLLRPETIKVGPAFSEQIVPEVPVEKHDVPLDLIVTENEIIDCRGEK